MCKCTVVQDLDNYLDTIDFLTERADANDEEEWSYMDELDSRDEFIAESGLFRLSGDDND